MISFGAHAASEQIFWDSWIAAGICTAPGEFTPEYSNTIQYSQGWSGAVEKVPAVYIGGILQTPAVMVTGFHINVWVSGPLEDEMIFGLNQYDQDGNLLSVFDRTWAVQIFQLTWQDANPLTGVPAGYRNQYGVSYIDLADLNSPSNVRA